MDSVSIDNVLREFRVNHLYTVNMLYGYVAYIGHTVVTASNKMCQEVVLVDHLSGNQVKNICYQEKLVVLFWANIMYRKVWLKEPRNYCIPILHPWWTYKAG